MKKNPKSIREKTRVLEVSDRQFQSPDSFVFDIFPQRGSCTAMQKEILQRQINQNFGTAD